MADTDPKVERLEHHDEIIETFMDVMRTKRRMGTATKHISKLMGLTEDVAYALTKEMRNTIRDHGATGLYDPSKYPKQLIAGRIAAGLKVPYNVATSYGEQDEKSSSAEEQHGVPERGRDRRGS